MPKTVPTDSSAVPPPRAGAPLTVVRPAADAAAPFVVSEPEPGRVVALQGRLDVAAAADARLALAGAVGAGTGDLVVDLWALEQVDATGLGVLVGAHRAAGRAGRALVLRDVPPQVERLLLVTRLHRVIRTERSGRDDATSCA